MSVNWEGSQARADAQPRMAEPVSYKVRCSRCGKKTFDFVQHYGTGAIVCCACLDAEADFELSEESDENN